MKPVKKDTSGRKNPETRPKKPYSPPMLTIHGTVEKITKGGIASHVEKAKKLTGTQLQGQ